VAGGREKGPVTSGLESSYDGATMGAMSELAPSALSELQRVYDAYMGAKMGELNITADELARTCKAFGWTNDGVGYLPWARKMLGIDT